MAASPSHHSFGNDEDAWFGGDDVAAESCAEQSVAAVGARIIGAKPFPIAARRLEELTRNPKARLEQVVSVLETDPGLSVRLLRLVNSAGYGLKVRVTSVRHAAVLVGTRRLHQVATTAAILDLFEANNETAIELLEHATVVGSLCRYLAVHLGLPHDELFTCGFLHDIGKLMLLDTEGDKYAELVRAHGGAPDQLHLHERRMFGFDHAVLGAHVLRAWNIPEPIPNVVAFHHQPARAMQDTLLSSMVHALRLADLMSYALVRQADVDGIALVSESEAAQYLDISEPQLAAMWGDLRALADRSRARSNGQPDMEVVAPRRLEVPRSLRPRRSGSGRSLAPTAPAPSERPGSRSSDVNETPTHFPCVACNKPSFGNICPACAGQVCPEHQVGADHWCVVCMREYERFREKNAVPGYLKVAALALVGFSVGASVTGVMVSQTSALWELIVAPISMLLLWGVLLPVAHRLWQRKRFVNSRPKGRVPAPIKLPRPSPVFISSLDANLENEGLLGPSVPPPSRSGLAIVAARAVTAESAGTTLESKPAVAPAVAPPTAGGSFSAGSTAAESALEPGATHSVPDSVREFELAAAALAATSEVMPQARVVQGSVSVALTGAAASLNPSATRDAAAAPIASLGEPSDGLSEFPSVGSAGELEHVVLSVSARLARDFPKNDYMGPSSDLRAASIVPVPEPDAPMQAAEPVLIQAAEPVLPAPAQTAEPALTQTAEPALTQAAAPVQAQAAAPVHAEAAEPVLTQAAAPVQAQADGPASIQAVQSVPLAVAPEADHAGRSEYGLVFPRRNLEQGCASRNVFRCAMPLSESCSPAPRSVSLRPASDGQAAGTSSPPGTLRGLG